jgi:hypothetical protein
MFEKKINTGNSILRTKAEVIWRGGYPGRGK